MKKHGNIDGQAALLDISAHGPSQIIIETMNGYIHVSSHIVDREPVTQISLYDHFELTITGRTKRMPLVVLDSDEYATHLVVIETEKRWLYGEIKDVPKSDVLFGRKPECESS